MSDTLAIERVARGLDIIRGDRDTLARLSRDIAAATTPFAKMLVQMRDLEPLVFVERDGRLEPVKRKPSEVERRLLELIETARDGVLRAYGVETVEDA